MAITGQSHLFQQGLGFLIAGTHQFQIRIQTAPRQQAMFLEQVTHPEFVAPNNRLVWYRFIETGNCVQQRGLTDTRWAQKADAIASRNGCENLSEHRLAEIAAGDSEFKHGRPPAVASDWIGAQEAEGWPVQSAGRRQ